MKTQVVQRDEDHDVYIGRPGYWGNPFKIGPDGSRDDVLGKHAEWLSGDRERLLRVHELSGLRLACYCKPLPCHGDLLAAIADLVG